MGTVCVMYTICRIVAYCNPLVAAIAVALAVWTAGGCPPARAATAPFVQLVGTAGAAAIKPGTCEAGRPAPAIYANVDLGSEGSYRYSPAYVVPYFFDDEGEFNLTWNQDATMFVSSYLRIEGVQTHWPLALAPLSTWYAAFGQLPDHTELALRVAAYDASGRSVATSRITWDCTTGVVRSIEHRGNAAGDAPPTARLVEYYRAALDHYFVTADADEIASLDSGVLAGWRRTGLEVGVYSRPVEGSSPVCRFYLPPSSGDSHFYSASPAECADVRARFPGFTYESGAVFAVVLPDFASGACPGAMRAVSRLWNARADSNHRYTADPAVKAAMLAQGYVAEGYGPAAVAFCALH